MRRRIRFFRNPPRKRQDSDFMRLQELLELRYKYYIAWYDSTQAELDRIHAAKADIIRAIRDKGVEVPEVTRIDELGAYILKIQIPEDEED